MQTVWRASQPIPPDEHGGLAVPLAFCRCEPATRVVLSG
jgi:hypothetical protein